MGIRVRSTRRTPKSYSLALELLEDRQLLSWSALSSAAPAFVGPLQTAVTSSAPKAAAPTPSATAPVQADSTADDSEYANSASGASDAPANNFVGPVQTTTGISYTSTTGNTSDSYTKDYTQTSSAYSSYTYYKSTNAGQYYQADQTAAGNESAAVLDAKPPAPLAQTPPLTRPTTPFVVAAIAPTLIATKATDAAPLPANQWAANAVAPNADEAPTYSADTPFVWTNQLRGALALATESLGDQFVLSSAYTAPILPVPHLAGLIGGTLALDLANLRGAVDQFFASLDRLAYELGPAPDLARWLLAGAAATGIFEFVRTKVQSAYKPWLDDDEEGIWAPYPVLVLVPPEDQP